MEKTKVSSLSLSWPAQVSIVTISWVISAWGNAGQYEFAYKGTDK